MEHKKKDIHHTGNLVFVRLTSQAYRLSTSSSVRLFMDSCQPLRILSFPIIHYNYISHVVFFMYIYNKYFYIKCGFYIDYTAVLHREDK